MDTRRLIDTAHALVGGDRGLLAMDESTPTCDKRFAKLGIATTEEMRRAYRDMIVTTPNLGTCISGAILYDETIRQKTLAGVAFPQALEQAGVVPGIKVDAGARPLAGFAGEQVTEGLDRLRERLAEYVALGARFAKWRAVIKIGAGIPTCGCLEANAHALARYAALCQEAGLVPIVEPEVLMDGDHPLERCREVTEQALHIVFEQLFAQRVLLEGMLLKPNMVLPGEDAADQSSVDAVADATIDTFLRVVPAAVPGIAFLSGGQASRLASAHLNAMNVRFRAKMPWALAFSFARAIQQPALEIWRGQADNVAAAQQALFHRADCNRAARRGEYDPAADAPQRA
ncbi:MAG: fructose-bisphosphate aldolase class I [Pseudomonadota bacterium]|nr:fructose-bisphosphate aldolase class I [Pseudomonadota bacterium]